MPTCDEVIRGAARVLLEIAIDAAHCDAERASVRAHDLPTLNAGQSAPTSNQAGPDPA